MLTPDLCGTAAKEIKMSIKDMRAEVVLLDKQIEELNAKRRDLRQKIADVQALFPVGARVTYEGAGCVWEITEIRPGYSFSSEPEYHGAKIKKDGTPGATKLRIWKPHGRKLIAVLKDKTP